jgi:hypothetical protein
LIQGVVFSRSVKYSKVREILLGPRRAARAVLAQDQHLDRVDRRGRLALALGRRRGRDGQRERGNGGERDGGA